MTDHEFDAALIAGAFELAAASGWPSVSVAAAARARGLKLERARARFADTRSILLRFGRFADSHALADALEAGPARERLFDVVMRRFDYLQSHRAGVRALLHSLPTDPLTALILAAATRRSMAWMLEAAGIATAGLGGALSTQGMVAVWLYTLRAWDKDDTADLSATMAALDRALSRAEQAATWLHRGPGASPEPGPKPFPEPQAGFGAEPPRSTEARTVIAGGDAGLDGPPPTSGDAPSSLAPGAGAATGGAGGSAG